MLPSRSLPARLVLLLGARRWIARRLAIALAALATVFACRRGWRRGAHRGCHLLVARNDRLAVAGRPGTNRVLKGGPLMSVLISLVKGFAGKPSHPPLTDVSIGAYSVGVAMLVAGAAGVEQQAMAKGALLAISGGLIVAIPTTLTGLLDYFDLPKRTAPRTLATYHLFVMLAATALFAATWVVQRPGYLDGEITTLGLLLGSAAFALLVIGGMLGGRSLSSRMRRCRREISVQRPVRRRAC